MQMVPYLSFKGQCEAAFTFYARCFGGRVGEIHRYAGSPMADDVPPDYQDKVMHGSFSLGDHVVLMGADVAPDKFEEAKGFSMSLHMSGTADAERIFSELAKDGRVLMPLEQTFWAARFGVVIDRFGIQWSLNCE
jgi:PhnB protein